MAHQVLDRLAVAVALIGAGTAAWLVLNWLTARHVTRRAPTDPLLAGVPKGQPAILYFSTDHCGPCSRQKPELARLSAEVGPTLRVISVDAGVDPATAARWSVWSAPTTIVLDGERSARHINRGFASLATLRRQLGHV
jgi:thiol-disulfide isomerase/thioredoxin